MRDAMHGVHDPASLPAAWRERAVFLRRHGATEAAETTSTLADELEIALRADAGVVLTLVEAARESGFSADYLGRLVARGAIPNVGRPRAPRIRRTDLPRKPGALPSSPTAAMFGGARRRVARAVVDATRQEIRDAET